ncbi:chitin deacetylase [Geranomyces michiganensis]|nr:chitin deacetylase [Geranomyces michiganensis]
MPKSWPPAGVEGPIPAAFLADPLVADALAFVNRVVPAQYLNIPPSTFVSPCVTKYSSPAAATANCYWPQDLCTRNSDTAAFRADISSCPAQNAWGLSFDDGPVADTPELLAALNKASIKSTFFVLGGQVSQFPAIVKAEDDQGHQVASHTWTHSPLSSLTNAQVVAELRYTEAMIFQTTGKVPTMFRPPCGDIDDRVRAIASALGYRAVLWNPDRDTQDASVATQTPAESAKIVETVKSWFVSQPGFLSLDHDNGRFTLDTDLGVVGAITAARAANRFPLSPMSISQCVGLPAYRNAAGNTTVATSTRSATRSSSVPATATASSASPSSTIVLSSASATPSSPARPSSPPSPTAIPGPAVNVKLPSSASSLVFGSGVASMAIAGLVAVVAGLF